MQTYREYMMDHCGYECITTFWEDFQMAELFNAEAIQETFDSAFEEWKSQYKYLTELALVLNHKCWYFHALKQMEYSKLYETLFRKVEVYATDNLKGHELEYYLQTTD